MCTMINLIFILTYICGVTRTSYSCHVCLNAEDSSSTDSTDMMPVVERLIKSPVAYKPYSSHSPPVVRVNYISDDSDNPEDATNVIRIVDANYNSDSLGILDEAAEEQEFLVYDDWMDKLNWEEERIVQAKQPGKVIIPLNTLEEIRDDTYSEWMNSLVKENNNYHSDVGVNEVAAAIAKRRDHGIPINILERIKNQLKSELTNALQNQDFDFLQPGKINKDVFDDIKKSKQILPLHVLKKLKKRLDLELSDDLAERNSVIINKRKINNDILDNVKKSENSIFLNKFFKKLKDTLKLELSEDLEKNHIPSHANINKNIFSDNSGLPANLKNLIKDHLASVLTADLRRNHHNSLNTGNINQNIFDDNIILKNLKELKEHLVLELTKELRKEYPRYSNYGDISKGLLNDNFFTMADLKEIKDRIKSELITNSRGEYSNIHNNRNINQGVFDSNQLLLKNLKEMRDSIAAKLADDIKKEYSTFFSNENVHKEVFNDIQKGENIEALINLEESKNNIGNRQANELQNILPGAVNNENINIMNERNNFATSNNLKEMKDLLTAKFINDLQAAGSHSQDNGHLNQEFIGGMGGNPIHVQQPNDLIHMRDRAAENWNTNLQNQNENTFKLPIVQNPPIPAELVHPIPIPDQINTNNNFNFPPVVNHGPYDGLNLNNMHNGFVPQFFPQPPIMPTFNGGAAGTEHGVNPNAATNANFFTNANTASNGNAVSNVNAAANANAVSDANGVTTVNVVSNANAVADTNADANNAANAAANATANAAANAAANTAVNTAADSNTQFTPFIPPGMPNPI